jgi:hypothetical protein
VIPAFAWVALRRRKKRPFYFSLLVERAANCGAPVDFIPFTVISPPTITYCSPATVPGPTLHTGRKIPSTNYHPTLTTKLLTIRSLSQYTYCRHSILYAHEFCLIGGTGRLTLFANTHYSLTTGPAAPHYTIHNVPDAQFSNYSHDLSATQSAATILTPVVLDERPINCSKPCARSLGLVVTATTPPHHVHKVSQAARPYAPPNFTRCSLPAQATSTATTHRHYDARTPQLRHSVADPSSTSHCCINALRSIVLTIPR